jgi:hypothetical protein
MLRAIVLAAAGLFLAGDVDSLKEFKIDDGKVKVLLPGKPEESSQKIGSGPMMKTYTAKIKEGVLIVSTLDVPESVNETEQQIKARLDTGRDQGVQNSKGKLQNETPIKLADKYAGRELVVELPGEKEVLRARYYLAEGRMVLLMAIGDAAFTKSPMATKFLDSLSVTK